MNRFYVTFESEHDSIQFYHRNWKHIGLIEYKLLGHMAEILIQASEMDKLLEQLTAAGAHVNRIVDEGEVLP